VVAGVVGVVIGVLVLVDDGSTMTVDVVVDRRVHASPGVNVIVTSPSPTRRPEYVVTSNTSFSSSRT
jgi:hypothetical protein